MVPPIQIHPAIFDTIQLSSGETLLQVSRDQPLMLVFLRHLGCVFCREALEDISAARSDLEGRGIRLVFIHMEDADMASEYLAKYDLQDCLHFADPECDLYMKFGLTKGRFSQLMGFQSLVKGFTTGVDLAQFGGKAFGDAFQMPGVFILNDGRVEAEFIHNKVWDRPDYLNLASCCTV